jgi:hypothetical protein
VKSGVHACKSGARPGVSSEVKGVLVAFGLVFVFESVGAVLTLILLFKSM